MVFSVAHFTSFHFISHILLSDFQQFLASPLAEVNGGRIPTMFPTDAHLHVRPRAVATGHGQFDEFAHAIFVQCHKGITRHDAFGLAQAGKNPRRHLKRPIRYINDI